MATLTPTNVLSARRFAWNIEFVDDRRKTFAGVYSRDLCVRDVLAELRAVFDFPSAPDLSLWLDGQSSTTTTTPTIFFEASPESLGHVIEAPEPGGKATSFTVAHHNSAACSMPGETDLSLHQQAGCATIVSPRRRRHSFYLPVNQKSNDPVVGAFPFRRRTRTPSKRSRRGSSSPSGRSESEATETAETAETAETTEHSHVVGPSWLMNAASQKAARKRQHEFRTMALGGTHRCAVSGLGRSWANSLIVGPGIHVAHIVPQLQYHLYPLVGDRNRDATDVQQGQTAPVPSDLLAAWENTWSIENSIVLSAAIHEAFDQRLLAIHPDSHLIRVFAPYDLITPYHGRKADFGRHKPHYDALRWHWDVCVIENMVGPWKQDIDLLPGDTASPAPELQRGAEDEDGGGDSTGPPPSASAGPDGRPGKRGRVSELQEERDENDVPDLSHGERSPTPSFAESGRQQGHGKPTKRQRTLAWLDGIPCGSQDGGICIRDPAPA